MPGDPIDLSGMTTGELADNYRQLAAWKAPDATARAAQAGMTVLYEEALRSRGVTPPVARRSVPQPPGHRARLDTVQSAQPVGTGGKRTVITDDDGGGPNEVPQDEFVDSIAARVVREWRGFRL